jgi:D-alanine-D-alanine ligase
MTGHSLVPMAAQAAGITYEDLCLDLLGSASLKTGAPPSLKRVTPEVA